VSSAISVMVTPMGAAALAARAETWCRRISQTSEAISIMNQMPVAKVAEGTWI
jgi:hypothetical protein